jgi:hypothetical protein
MIEDSICESFEPIQTLDLPHVPTQVTCESPNSATEPKSSLFATSVNQNFPKF